MKKVVIVILAASFSSLVAAASNEVITNPGDPAKSFQTPAQKNFSLSKGYFSLFNILPNTIVTTKEDTLKSKPSAVPSTAKAETNKK